jgi:hypothetical protein
MLSSVLRSFDLRYVGTCRKCMRISFAAMTLSWVAFCAAVWVGPAASAAAAALCVALTALWIAHIAARSTRVVRSQLPTDYSRRLALHAAVTAIAGAAAVSVLSQRAFADGDMSACGGWNGGPESGCKPCPSNCYRQSAECGCVPCASCCQGGQEC